MPSCVQQLASHRKGYFDGHIQNILATDASQGGCSVILWVSLDWGVQVTVFVSRMWPKVTFLG